ncbi:MAG: AAA family ATPase [Pseudomonadota bacterium]
MYQEHFGFSGEPFKLTPDPRFFFGSKSHNKAMAYLHYGLRQGDGFIVITGEIGAGKSMLITHLMDQIDQTNVVAADLITPNLPPNELVAHILSAFRIEPAGDGPTAEIEAFEDFLFDQMNRGRRVLLIVDEAQNLPVETLEELRVLSNLDYDGTPLFQVFLIAQPDFRPLIAADGMEQLRQRVIASYHLEPLSRDDVKAYVEHRLSVVGWAGDPKIDDAAYELVFDATGGVPRRINKLFNRVLLYCSIEGVRHVTADVARVVIDDIADEDVGATPALAPPPATTSDEASDEPMMANGHDLPQDKAGEPAPMSLLAAGTTLSPDKAGGEANVAPEDTDADPFSFDDLDAPNEASRAESAPQTPSMEDASGSDEVDDGDLFEDAVGVEHVEATAAPDEQTADIAPASAPDDAPKVDVETRGETPGADDAVSQDTEAKSSEPDDVAPGEEGAPTQAGTPSSPIGRAIAGAAAAIGLGGESKRRASEDTSFTSSDGGEEVSASDEAASSKASELAMNTPEIPSMVEDAPASVLDRVRAKKSKEEEPKRKSATLSEVASAIKEERARVAPAAPDTEPTPDPDGTSDGDQDRTEPHPDEGDLFEPSVVTTAERDEAGLDSEERALVEGVGGDDPTSEEKARRWREALAKTVSATKADLQTAHDHISRLRRKLTSAEQTRRKTEAQISERLDRAESLLTEIRDAWR